MRDRKFKRQIESYHVAANSAGGWLTEKKYRADSIFLEDESIAWYEQPEPSTEKKMEQFRRAEADAKKELTMRKTFKGQSSSPYRKRSFTRWDQRSPSPTAGPSFRSAPIQDYSQYRDVGSFRPNFIPPMLQHMPQSNFVPVGNQGFHSVDGTKPKKDGCFTCGDLSHGWRQCPKKTG